MTARDDGLFGPGSVTWRLHADPILWVGGLRSLLLQALHPVAMAGVAQHSAFREDAWGRLLRTARYVGTTTYGTTEEALAAGASVRRVHRGLGGLEPRTGRRYMLEDADLLRWVHCCLVDSFLSTYRRAHRDLGPDDADRYVSEQTRMASLVGLKASDVPSTAHALQQYFEDIRPQLAASTDAFAAARLVLAPPMPLRVQLLTPARPAWSAVSALALASLPSWARRLYRLPGLPTTDLAATLGLHLLATLLAQAPAAYRESPHLRAARQRLADRPPRHLSAVTD